MAKKKVNLNSAVPLSFVSVGDIKDRLTVVINVAHEHYGDQPFGLNIVYQQPLESKEQVYSRRYMATEEWKPIDLNWLEEVGTSLVIIENLEGKGLLVNPTVEEKAATSAKILEISYTKNSKEADTVPSMGFCTKQTDHPSSLYIRSRSGTATYRLTLIPK